MKCPECIKDGKKSTVNPGWGATTLMYCPPYYDEEGEYHHHDSNTSTFHYTCSNGHAWKESSKGSCWCGWGQEEKSK